MVDGGLSDASIRPNRIIAVSLRNSMLSLERARAVVDVVTRELLTPYGLRKLSPLDPYRNVFTAPSRQTGDGRDNLQASFPHNA